MTDDPVIPDDLDVLCGSGSQVAKHPGNQRFRTIVMNHYEWFTQATTKNEKMKVTKSIQDAVLIEGGRFLKKHPIFEQWHLASSKVGRDKISHILRLMKKNRTLELEEDDNLLVQPIDDEACDLLVATEGNTDWFPPEGCEERLLVIPGSQHGGHREEHIDAETFQHIAAASPVLLHFESYHNHSRSVEETTKGSHIDEPFQGAFHPQKEVCKKKFTDHCVTRIATERKLHKEASGLTSTSSKSKSWFVDNKAVTASLPSLFLDCASREHRISHFQEKTTIKDGDRRMSREEATAVLWSSTCLPKDTHLSQPSSVQDDSNLLGNSSSTQLSSMGTLPPQSTVDSRWSSEVNDNVQGQQSSNKPNKNPIVVASSPFLRPCDLSQYQSPPIDDEDFIKLLGPLGQPRVFDPSKEGMSLCNKVSFENATNVAARCFNTLDRMLGRSVKDTGQRDASSFTLYNEEKDDI